VRGNNEDEASLTPRQADLQVTKVQIKGPEQSGNLAAKQAIDPSTIVAGTRIYYLLRVANLGPDAALDATVSDTLPAGISNVEFSPNFGNSWFSWTGTRVYPNLAAGGSDEIVIRGTVAAGQTGSLTNTASVASDKTHDPVPDNNQDELETTVAAQADLDLTKEELAAPGSAGGPIEYRVTVTNLGPSDATDVTIEDIVDESITDVQFSVDGGENYDLWISPYTYTYTLGPLAKGAQFVLLIKGTVVDSPELEGDSIPNTASVRSTSTDSDLTNNWEAIETPLNAFVDLAIVKTGSPATVVAGEQIIYTLTATNNSDSFAAQNVHIDDILDPNLFEDIEVNETGTGDSWISWTNRYALGNLGAGESRTVYLRATVKSSVTAPLVSNTASVDTDTPDTNPDNDAAREETPVERRADLRMEKKLRTAPENVLAGGQVEYELVYTNLGPSDATNVVVTDAVPAAITNPEAAFCTTTS
jgi:uncharacterized repeat protein (TIGR01451 family)